MKTLARAALTLFAASSFAEGLGRNYFTPYELKNCKVTKIIKSQRLELCALSAPTQDPQRREFSISLRDPSTLDYEVKTVRGKPVKGLGNADAKHKLVAELSVPAKTGEYLHYEMVASYELSDTKALIVVPLVVGTPDDYSRGRVLLYLYDGQKTLTPLWESPECSEGCRGQNLSLRYKPGAVERAIFLQQVIGEDRVTLQVLWDGAKIVPVPAKK